MGARRRNDGEWMACVRRRRDIAAAKGTDRRGESACGRSRLRAIAPAGDRAGGRSRRRSPRGFRLPRALPPSALASGTTLPTELARARVVARAYLCTAVPAARRACRLAARFSHAEVYASPCQCRETSPATPRTLPSARRMLVTQGASAAVASRPFHVGATVERPCPGSVSVLLAV